MIFGFSTFAPATKRSGKVEKKRAEYRLNEANGEPALSHREQARIFDLEHERKLRALHALIANGASLSEAARLIGISRLCAHRWNDYGRR